MPYRKEIFQAPGIYEVKKYHTYRLGGNRVRGPNIQKTDAGLKKRNSRRAKTKLYRLIATNFRRDDLRIDLTYANPEPTAEEAKNRIRKFIRDLRKKYKKKNAELKYIYVTEHVRHRIHHHVLINDCGISRSEINECWPWAKFNYRSFRYFDGSPEDAMRLAEYFVKETDEEIRSETAVQKIRWVPSKNLKQPNVKKITIYARKWKDNPTPKKGYQIVKVESGYTADGFPYQFYRMYKVNERNVWPITQSRVPKKKKECTVKQARDKPRRRT